MSSALSASGGAGLGTLGLPPSVLRRMAEAAGFTRFEPLDLGHPVNAFYVLRPRAVPRGGEVVGDGRDRS